MLRTQWNAWARPLFDDNLRIFLLWGGRQGGRSYAVSRKIVQDATAARRRWACIRWSHAQTGGSQRADIIDAIETMGVVHLWNTTQTSYLTNLVTGSVVSFHGLRGQDGLRSLTNLDGAWLEECQFLEDPDFGQLLDTLIRRQRVKLFLTGNARYESDPAYKWSIDMRGESDAAWIETTYMDNAFLSTQARRRAEQVKRTDPDIYDWEWLGRVRRSSAESTVVSAQWIEAAVKLWEKRRSSWLGHVTSVGLDPADGGGDDCVVAAQSGAFLRRVEILSQPKGLLTAALERVDGLCGDLGAKVLYFDSGSTPGNDVSAHYAGRAVAWRVRPVAFGSGPMAPRVGYGGSTNGKMFRSAQRPDGVERQGSAAERLAAPGGAGRRAEGMPRDRARMPVRAGRSADGAAIRRSDDPAGMAADGGRLDQDGEGSARSGEPRRFRWRVPVGPRADRARPADAGPVAAQGGGAGSARRVLTSGRRASATVVVLRHGA